MAQIVGGLLLVLAVGGGVLYYVKMEAVSIGHDAMAPTLVAGDRVLVWKTTEFERGHIALCPHPAEPGRFVMGRVVAFEGSQLSMERAGILRVDGRSPERDVRGEVPFDDNERRGRVRMRWGTESIHGHDYTFFEMVDRTPHIRPHRVERGMYLLADNRSSFGEDSRSYGDVRPETCIGRVFLRLTSAGRTPDVIGNRALDYVE